MPSAPPPPPPQLTERRQPTAPSPPAATPQFGPPPSDIAIVQEENRRRIGAPPPQPSTNMAALGGAPAVAPRHGQKLATITFNRGAALDNERMSMLKQVADSARARGTGLVVVGHASGAGPANDRVRRQIANFDLSQDRANAVAAALVQLGVPQQSIAIAAVGDAERLEDGAGASNQRAEIFLAN
jgi:outer membrane protein OmpA-like peptidoglycan-associated protein